ncbi:hypothetical protein M1L60_44780 [Actinoplanes sp. TRM 88003]|uniref:Secreted protein n=1 Tax=Paractinoplanes aksuensis TaxID=2939490 RepID=A0ABT1E3J8_9ACTN|nr:hypothetical protein [Actinoplanes aksuensis]MCO8277713.1 hypothetical protein [Actinoplanes aksuensis]
MFRSRIDFVLLAGVVLSTYAGGIEDKPTAASAVAPTTAATVVLTSSAPEPAGEEAGPVLREEFVSLGSRKKAARS